MRWITRLTPAILVTAIAASAWAQDGQQGPPRPQEREESPDPEGPAPAIGFDRTEHDFGNVLDTQKHSTTFRFTNRGESALEITSARSSCGCTVPELEKKSYAPGESGELTVVFDPENRRGPQHRAVTVLSNDPANRRAQLQIHANVKPAIEITPRAVQFGRVKPGATQVVMIDAIARVEGVSVSDPKVTYGDGFTVEMANKNEKDTVDGEQVRRSTIMVTLSDSALLGRVAGRISLGITDRNGQQSTQTIPVTGRIIGDLRVAPTRVNLGFLSGGESFERSVRVSSASEKDFRILGMEEDPMEGPDGSTREPVLDTIDWDATPVAEDENHAYQVTIRGTAPTDTNRIYTRLIVETDREDEERLPLYLTARMRDGGSDEGGDSSGLPSPGSDSQPGSGGEDRQ